MEPVRRDRSEMSARSAERVIPATHQASRLDRCEVTQPRRLAQQDRGFTLLEVTLVLLILAIAIGVVVPHLRDTDRARLESHVRKLAVMVRFLRHEAILNGRTYRLNYSIDEGSYWVTSADGDEDESNFVPEEGILAKPVVFPEPIAFADLVLPDTFGEIQEGAGFTDFYPDGYVDLTLVHLGNGQEVYTVYVDSLTGHVSVAAGYHALPTL